MSFAAPIAPPALTADFVIAGGGLAGLCLACRLVRSPLAGASIVIVDRQPTPLQARCWSYWTDTPTTFDPVVAQRWRHVHLAGDDYALTAALPAGCFELVRGGDLTAFAHAELAKHGGVTFRRGTLEQVRPLAGGAAAQIDSDTLTTGWVFDSTGWPAAQRRKHPPLSMYFRSWQVTAERPAFNPEALTFCDTRTPQPGELRFFYVLPCHPQRALVQLVSYGLAPVPPAEARSALSAYLARAWGLPWFAAAEAEAGCLPLIPSAHPRRLGPRHLALGARGGLVRASTGYGLRAIERDSAAIVESLVRYGTPWRLPRVSRRHQLYDSLLLDVLARRGRQGAAIFAAMFRRNPLARVLRFLEAASTPAEELALIATLPSGLFLRALPGWLAGSLPGRLRPAAR